MLPGMNPRQMQSAMKKMGIKQEDIDATEVIIKTADREFYFEKPSVAKVNMMGQNTWQIAGDYEERAIKAEIEDEDVNTVMEQADCSAEVAREAISRNNGDLAAAILELKGQNQ